MSRQASRTGPKRLGECTLTAADWAEAALQLIAEVGVRGLTVDALAQRLGATKGSFYWHFKTRAELLAAAIERWEQRSTRETIKGLEAVTHPLRRLELIVEASSQPPRSHSFYSSLAEATDDPAVRAALSRVASARIEYLETCYRDIGLARPVARSKALLAYAAYRGLLQLAREAPSVLTKDWSTYLTTLRQALVPANPK